MATNKSMRKYTYLTTFSGAVAEQLRHFTSDSGMSLSRRIKEGETLAAARGIAFHQASSATAALKEGYLATRSALRIANRSMAGLCIVEHVEGAEIITALDKGNDLAFAERLETAVLDIEGVGKGLSKLLGQHRRSFQAAEAAWLQAVDRATVAARDLDAAVFGLEAVVVETRAMLATHGVKVAPRRARKVKAPRAGPDAPVVAAPPTPLSIAA